MNLIKKIFGLEKKDIENKVTNNEDKFKVNDLVVEKASDNPIAMKTLNTINVKKSFEPVFKGRILKNSKEDLVKIKDKHNLEGIIVDGNNNIYNFKYKDILNVSTYFNIQEGLGVTFQILEKNKVKFAIRIQIDPVQYGFVTYYNDEKKEGFFISNTQEKIKFFANNIRNEDEPIFDALYLFDILVDSERKKKIDYPKGHFVNNTEDPKIGQTRNGIIKSYNDFGILVDIGFIRPAFIHLSEIKWDENESPNFRTFYKINQQVNVLILKVGEKNGRMNIEASIKALVEAPTNLRAINIFRLSEMPDHIKIKKLTEIIEREDVLPEVKIATIRIIQSDQNIYRTFKENQLDKLYNDCKNQMEMYLCNGNYEKAYSLLQEYLTYDFSAIVNLSRFPDSFIKLLKATTIGGDEVDKVIYSEVDLEAIVFARKNNCEFSLANKYLQAVHNNLQNSIEINNIRSIINIKPSIIIDEEL